MSKHVFRPTDLGVGMILDYNSLIFPSRKYKITAIVDPLNYRRVNHMPTWNDLVEMRSLDHTEYLRFTVKYVVTSSHFSLSDEAWAISNVVNFDGRTANGTQSKRRTCKQAG